MLVLVALIVAALVLPPVGDAARRVGARRRRSRCSSAPAPPPVRARGGVRSFVTVLSPAPLIVLVLFLVVSPVRGLLFPERGGGAVAGPSRSSTPIVHVVLDELPQTTLMGATRPRSTPSCSRTSPGSRASPPGTATRRRSTTSRPRRSRAAHRRAAAGGRAADRARPSAQPVHAVRAQPPADGDRADHRRLPRRGSAPTSARGRRTGCESLESDLEVVVQHLLLPDDLREGLPADRPRLGGVRDEGRRPGRAFAAGRTSRARRAPRGSPATTRRRGSSARSARRVAARRAPAAAVPPLDAPARPVALPARRPRSTIDRRVDARGSTRAGSGRSGRSTRGSSATCSRPSTSTGCWAACSTRCARPGSTTTR